MRPIKIVEESNKYLEYIADSVYRLSNQYSINKSDRDLLEHYADSLMDIKKNLEGIKNNWVAKQEMEKEQIEQEIEETGKKKTNEVKTKEKTNG